MLIALLVEGFLVTLKRVQGVADLVAHLASIGAVRGEVAPLQVLLAAVAAPRNLGAEAADHGSVGAAHQVTVGQLIQPRVQA